MTKKEESGKKASAEETRHSASYDVSVQAAAMPKTALAPDEKSASLSSP